MDYDQKLLVLTNTAIELDSQIARLQATLAEVKKERDAYKANRPLLIGDRVKVVRWGQCYYPCYTTALGVGVVEGFTDKSVAQPSSVSDGNEGFVIGRFADTKTHAVRLVNGNRIIIDRSGIEFVS